MLVLKSPGYGEDNDIVNHLVHVLVNLPSGFSIGRIPFVYQRNVDLDPVYGSN